MNGFAGRSEFFRREAGDYLRELGPLVTEGAAPPGDALARLTRALRGASMLAGPASYTEAARQLEQAARLLREGRLDWPATRPILRDAMAEFQRLTEFAQAWDPARDGEAEALEQRLRALTGTAGEPAAPAPERQQEGLRAFVTREATTLAAAVAAAAEAVAADPESAQAALAQARGAMQSLHGLAGLSDLVPLGDILDALDSLLADLDRHPAVPPGAAGVLRLAATALSSIAQDVIRHGRPRDPAAVEALVDGLFVHFARGEGTVPIEDLLLAGADRPLHGLTPAPATSIDLASLGERLRSGAAQLRTAPGPAVAALRGYSVLATIRRAPGGLGQEPAATFLSRLAASLEQRDASTDQALIAIIDQAGELLASGSDHRSLAASLAALTGPLPAPVVTVGQTATEGRESDEAPPLPIEALAPDDDLPLVPIEALAPDDDLPVVPVESLAPEEDTPVVPVESLAPEDDIPVVPVESLAPEDDSPVVPIEALALDDDLPVVPIEALAPALDYRVAPPPTPFAGPVVPADRTRLEQTLSAYSRLVAANAPVLPLEALIPPAVPPRMPLGSRSAAVEVEAEFDVVPIEALLYRGPGAMTRADDVRRQLEEALKVASVELDRVEPLVRELLDLVPLAVADGR
jgi:hypothetical protein